MGILLDPILTDVFLYTVESRTPGVRKQDGSKFCFRGFTIGQIRHAL